MAILIAGALTGIAATQSQSVPSYITALTDKVNALTGKVITLTDKIDTALADVPRMESYHDILTVTADNTTIWSSWELYDYVPSQPYDVGHFNITFNISGLNDGEFLVLWQDFYDADMDAFIFVRQDITTDGVHTFDFQATAAHIATQEHSVTDEFVVAYAVTVTYLPKD